MIQIQCVQYSDATCPTSCARCKHACKHLNTAACFAGGPCRRNYFDATDALIYVIDSHDAKRLAESGSELDMILEVRARVCRPCELQVAMPGV